MHKENIPVPGAAVLMTIYQHQDKIMDAQEQIILQNQQMLAMMLEIKKMQGER